MNLYSGSGLSQKGGVIYTLLSLFFADNDNEAKGIMYDKLSVRYPAEGGYSNSTIVVVAANEETLQQVYDDIIKPNIEKYDNL